MERDETPENGGAADGMILGQEKIDPKENFVSRNGQTKKKVEGEGKETKRKSRRQGEREKNRGGEKWSNESVIIGGYPSTVLDLPVLDPCRTG